MITENLSTLKIHKLTQEQYDRELEAGRIDENALYLTPDEEIDFPVDSVNGKTGAVKLTAADVGALGNSGVQEITDGSLKITSSDNTALRLDKTINDNNYVREYMIIESDRARVGFGINGAVTNQLSLYEDRTTLSKPLAIGSGGTGATTKEAALTNLGITATAAELNKMDGVTATTAELNYVDGVTSNIQTQLDSKAASSHIHNDLNTTNGRALLGSEAKSSGSGYNHWLRPQRADNDSYYLGSSGNYWDTAYIEKLIAPGGTFNVDSQLFVNKQIRVPNGISIRSESTTGEEAVLMFLGNKNQLFIGGGEDNVYHTGDTIINSMAGSVYINNSVGGLRWVPYNADNYQAIFSPRTDLLATCGSSNYRWYRLYAENATVQTSDEREKSDIMSIADYPVTYSRDGSGNVFEQLFTKLQPKTYTRNSENSGELHIGFVAQDIENSLEELGLSSDDLGLIVHDYWEDEETGEEKDRYGLGYEEFIALNTHMIQKQQAKITELEERIAKLESLVNIGN